MDQCLRSEGEYHAKEYSLRGETHIPGGSPVLFLEVTVHDSSDFQADVTVVGEERYNSRILHVQGAVVPDTVAAAPLQLRDHTGQIPHA